MRRLACHPLKPAVPRSLLQYNSSRGGCGNSVLACGGRARDRKLFLPARHPEEGMGSRRNLLCASRSRLDRIPLWHPLRRFLGTSRIYPLAGIRRIACGRDIRAGIPSRRNILCATGHRQGCAVCLPVSGNSESRSAGCHDQRRPGRGLLLAIQQQPLLPALEAKAGSGFYTYLLFQTHQMLECAFEGKLEKLEPLPCGLSQHFRKAFLNCWIWIEYPKTLQYGVGDCA